MQRCIHPRGQTPPGRHKRAKKLFKCFQKCPSSKHQPPRARDALPVRAETCWPHAQGGRCCTFSLPQSSRSQVDFPTLSISTLTGVVSSHFPGEPLGGGGGDGRCCGFGAVPDRTNHLPGLSPPLEMTLTSLVAGLSSQPPGLVLLALSPTRVFTGCPQNLPCSLLWSPPHVHTSDLMGEDVPGDADHTVGVLTKELRHLDPPLLHTH